MGAAIGILFLIPFLYKPSILGPRFKPIFSFFFWLFISDVLWLGYLGGQPANDINIAYSQFFTLFYFAYFLFILPLIESLESKLLKI
jgi:quinol-cytochrome oxidoreductase complex cytochrome b subunit